MSRDDLLVCSKPRPKGAQMESSTDSGGPADGTRLHCPGEFLPKIDEVPTGVLGDARCGNPGFQRSGRIPLLTYTYGRQRDPVGKAHKLGLARKVRLYPSNARRHTNLLRLRT